MAGNEYTLSVVVAVVSDTTARATGKHLRPCLESLTSQADPPSLEILVPHYPQMEGIEALRTGFPQVRFLEIAGLKRYTGAPGNREHHNELRAHGVAAARGKLIALIEDHGVADTNWCRGIVEAHAATPAAAVGGAIENRIDRALNWAVYFCDFGQYGNPVPPGDAAAASDANVSYKRAALESVRGVWEEVFHEGAVNHALRLRGERLILAPELVVSQNRFGLDLGTAVKERYIWGWSYGAGRKLAGISRLIWAGLAPALPLLIVARIGSGAAARKRHLGAFLRSSPLVILMAAAWCWGEMIAYLTGARIAEELPAGLPPGTLAPNPRLSVVVVPTGGSIEPGEKAEITQSLAALERQGGGWPAEVIVPHDTRLPGFARLRTRFPAVRFIAIDPVSAAGSSEILDELRARGVAAASGDIVAVIEDHVRPDTEWARQIAEAHRRGYAAIGGAIENGVDRMMNWAAYFSDIGRYHNPLPAGESAYASVVNVSYKRADLETIRAVWQERFNETSVHWALTAQRKKLALSPDIIVWQHRENLRFGKSAREFFNWGRSYGGTRAKLAGPVKRLIYAAMAPAIPFVLLLRNARDVRSKGRLTGVWLKSLPLSMALTGAWCCGELTGYLAGEVKPAWPKPVRESQAAR